MSERCSWCGRAIEAGDGYRLYELGGGRRAAFCRLEHVVPWAIRGAAWDPGGEPPEPAPPRCAWCEGELPDTRLLLVRARGEHDVTDAFCSLEHLLAWAKAGGRYR
jgi:hypothetical protein